MSVAAAEPTFENSHLVLFYGQDEELTSAAGQFCSDGLGAGDAVLVVATGPHRRAIRASLVDRRPGLARVGELEAASTLLRITGPDGCVERGRFFDVMEPALATMAKSSETGRVRIFGEMVALLAAYEDPNGAIALEELWNELAEGPVPFSLLCGYPRPDAGGRSTWVDRVCEVHTAVIDGDVDAS